MNRALSFIVSVLFSATFAHGSLIEYNFNVDANYSSIAPDLSGTAITFYGVNSLDTVPDYTNLGGAAADNDVAYVVTDSSMTALLRFTVDPETGYLVNINSVTFDLAGKHTAGSLLFRMYYSTDGGSNFDEFISGASSASTISGTTLQFERELQSHDTGLAGQDAVVFELRGSHSAADDFEAYIDNLTVEGTVIPEPAVASLIALAGGGMIVGHRFSARAKAKDAERS